MLMEGILLLHNNSYLYAARSTMEAIKNLEYKFLPHLLYTLTWIQVT